MRTTKAENRHTFKRLVDCVAVADRPQCAYCGRYLKPYVMTAWPNEPAPGATGVEKFPSFEWCAEQAAAAFESGWREHFSNPPRFDILSVERSFSIKWEIRYWAGVYDGTNRSLNPLFCRNYCGIAFGNAAHKAGYRMKGK